MMNACAGALRRCAGGVAKTVVIREKGCVLRNRMLNVRSVERPVESFCCYRAAQATFFRSCLTSAFANSKTVRQMKCPISIGMHGIAEPSQCRVSVTPRAAFLALPQDTLRSVSGFSSQTGHHPMQGCRTALTSTSWQRNAASSAPGPGGGHVGRSRAKYVALQSDIGHGGIQQLSRLTDFTGRRSFV